MAIHTVKESLLSFVAGVIAIFRFRPVVSEENRAFLHLLRSQVSEKRYLDEIWHRRYPDKSKRTKGTWPYAKPKTNVEPMKRSKRQ